MTAGAEWEEMTSRTQKSENVSWYDRSYVIGVKALASNVSPYSCQTPLDRTGDPISGTVYYLSLLLFAAMPWIVSRR